VNGQKIVPAEPASFPTDLVETAPATRTYVGRTAVNDDDAAAAAAAAAAG